MIPFLSSLASAQAMSGNYIVAATGGNFSSFAAAATALSTRGVNGPVQIIGRPGTYSGNWVIKPIAGVSVTNNVVFRSTVTNINNLKCKLLNTTGEIVTINGGVQYVTLDGFSFEQSTGPAIQCR